MMDTKCNIIVKLLVLSKPTQQSIQKYRACVSLSINTILPRVGNWHIIVNLRHVYAIGKHKLTKIVEPHALFMLLLNNKRESMQHIVAGASQHVVEEVRGMGVDVGTF